MIIQNKAQIKNNSTLAAIENTTNSDVKEINYLLSMFTLDKSKNFITENEIINHLIGVSFELPVNFLDLIKSELFQNYLIRFESELFLNVFFVTREDVEKGIETITKTVDGRTLVINIINISFDNLIFDDDFKICFLGLFGEKEEWIDKPSYYNTLFIFKDFTFDQLFEDFKKYKIGLSGKLNTRRHLISPLEHKFNLYLIAMGLELEHINKFYHDSIDKKNSRSKKMFNLELKSSKQNTTSERLRISFPVIESMIQNISRSTVITNNYQNYDVNKEFNRKKGNNTGSQKREFSTSSVIKSDELVLEGETVTKLVKKEIMKGQNPKQLNILESIKDNNKKDFFMFIEEILNEIKIKKKEISNDQLKIIQHKLENEYLELIKTKLSENQAINYQLTKCVDKAYRVFKNNLNHLRKYKTDFPVLKDYFDDKKLILLTLVVIITYFSKMSATNLISRTGNEILWSICKDLRKDKNELAMENNVPLSFKKFKDNLNWNEDLNIKLGNLFINSFLQIELIIEDFRLKENSNYEKQKYFVINEEYIDMVIDNMMLLPPSLPMVTKPNEWSNSLYGGFLTNSLEEIDLVSGSISSNSHLVENRENLYKAINYENNRKFSVNSDLLEYLDKEGEYLLRYEDEVLDKNNDLSSKLQYIFTIKLAKIYNYISIYFPFYINTSADWRGRIYTKSFFLSYQGNDLSNALVQFWDGKSLTSKGLDYLYIVGANAYDENGISKRPYNERIKWVNDNYERILEMDPGFILKADAKYQFVAFCLNIRKLHKDKNAKIYTPVFLDATSSGFQHIAAMIKDQELAVRSNLLSQGPTDGVSDIYGYIVELVNTELNRLGKTNEELKHFTKIKLTRKLAKWNVMCKMYGMTLFGGSKQLQSRLDKVVQKQNKDDLIYTSNHINNDQNLPVIISELEKVFDKTELPVLSYENGRKKKDEIKEIYFKVPAENKLGYILATKRDLFEIARVINEQVFIAFPGLKSIFDYFGDITKLLNKLNIPITWFPPNGLKLTQHYNKSEVERCSFRIGTKIRTVVYRKTNKEKTNTIKQFQAIIPNITHSLDASHLINVLNTVSKDSDNMDVITVHDCFGTHPNDMEKLSFIVKNEFISLYLKEDFLKKFHKKIIESIKDHNYTILKNKGKKPTKEYILLDDEVLNIPDLPKKGKLDLKQIVDSKYMIT